MWSFIWLWITTKWSVEKAANICLEHHIVTVAVDPDMQVITRSQPPTEIDGLLFHQEKIEKCG